MKKEEQEKKIKVSLILLASGFGKRYGANKLLEEYGGKKLYQTALQTAVKSGADLVVIVTGYREIADYVKHFYKEVQVVWNEHPQRGISESLKLGLMAAEENEGCGFLVCDQPGLSVESLENLLESFRAAPSRIHLCCYGQRRGNPVIFPRKYYGELKMLTGDLGGRQVIKKYPDQVTEIPVASEVELWDIDTAEDKERMEKQQKIK